MPLNIFYKHENFQNIRFTGIQNLLRLVSLLVNYRLIYLEEIDCPRKPHKKVQIYVQNAL